jgi:hypothetical protein
MRRSTRIRKEIPVRLRSLDPKTPFDVLTRTLIVNSQGCGLQTTVEVPADAPVEIALQDRVTSGRVLNSSLVDAERNIWVVGIELDQPGNFWGIHPAPADWIIPDPATNLNVVEGPKAHPFARRKQPKSQKLEIPTNVESAATPGAPSLDIEQYRVRFESMLEEFGARLRNQISADWENWRAEASVALSSIQQELGRELGSDAERWRRETEKAAEHLASLLKSSDERARIADQQADQVAAAVTSAQAQISAAVVQMERAAAEAQGAGSKAAADAQASRDEIARLKSDLNELASNAPAFLQAAMKHPAAQASVSAGAEIEEKVTAAVTSGLQQLQQRLQELSTAADADIRRRLLADFEQRQAAFLQSAGARIAEIDALQTSLQSSADQLSSQLSRQAEEAMAGLRVHVEQLIASHEAELASRFSTRQETVLRQLDAGDERLRALHAAAEQALKGIDEHQQSVAQTQANLASAAEAALETIDQRRAAAQAALDKAVAESLEKLNAGFESGQQQLESRLQQQAWDHEAQVEAASARLQDRLNAALQKLDVDIGLKQAALSANLVSDSGKVADEVRNRFRDDLESERRQRDAELQARQNEVAASMAALQSQHQKVSADLAELQKNKAQLESLVASLPDTVRAQAQQQASEAWEILRARSEQHIAETLQLETQRGSARLLEEINASALRLREEMATQAQQTAAQLQARLAQVLEEQQQQVTVALLQKSEQVVNDEIVRASRHIQDAARSDSAAALAALRADSGKVVADHAATIASASQQAASVAGELQSLQAAAAANSQALQKQLDDAQKWLGEHTAEFQKTVHDSFLLAGGEIRGRVHAAVDSADEMIRQKSKDLMANVEASNAEHVQALARQAQEVEARIAAIQANATGSAEAMLKSRLSETLDLFREDAARLAESAVARWQAAMDDTLRSIPDLLRTRLEVPAKPASASDKG